MQRAAGVSNATLYRAASSTARSRAMGQSAPLPPQPQRTGRRASDATRAVAAKRYEPSDRGCSFFKPQKEFQEKLAQTRLQAAKER